MLSASDQNEQHELIEGKDIQAAAEGLKAIAHTTRLDVLCRLQKGPMTVNELMEATGTSQSNLSHHLAKMRAMGLVESRREGNSVYYSLADEGYADLIQVLRNIYCKNR